MLRLRKILLSNYLYLIILIIVLSISLIRLSIKRYSVYNENKTSFILIIDKYSIDEDKLTIYLKDKETIIGNYYFKTKKEKNYFINNIKLGDKLKIEGSLSKPSTNNTNNLFNYQEYLYNKRIFYLLYINKYKKIENNHNIIYFIKNIIRKRLNNNKYSYTFILGDKSYLSSKVITSYQENGISHLFAISGMHISLLSAMILKLLKKIKVSENKRYFISIICLIIYHTIADKSPSILRGTLFFILFSINKIYYFYVKPYNLFILALSISLLINPYYIFDIGFQYSFLISLTLLLTSKYLVNNNYIKSLIKVSIISSIISIPIQIKNFYQINLLCIVNNLIFVPLISLIIFPLSLLVLIFPPLEIIYNPLTIILEKISILISKINLFKLVFIKLPSIIYLIYLLIIIISFYIYLVKNKKRIIILLIIILLVHSNLNILIPRKYIYYLDVGQGDSTLIHLNNKNLLIDTGGKLKYTNKEFNKRLKETSIVNSTISLLKSLGIKELDYLIITHGDYDHMGEAINLVENFKVEKVIFNCGEFNDLEQELIKVLNKKKIPYYSCIKELNIDNNKLYFLQTKEYDNENDNSNVIYTEIDSYKFMFMGDAGVDKEKDILDKYNVSNIDVLKVGHHGSKTSSSKEFINEINPRYSIISVGKNNRYGHPNKEVLKNLEDTRIYRTDQDGSIMFKIRNNKLQIETCIP